MGRAFRFKLRMRRFARRHSRAIFVIRSFLTFAAAFGAAYGFAVGAMSKQAGYDPHSYAIGASFLFAIACVGIVSLSMRLRWLRRKLRMIVLQNEALADRNWELKEAEERARSLFESQSDLIVLRDARGIITFVNDAFCRLAQQPRTALVGSRFALNVLEQGAAAHDANGTRVHDQKVETALGPRWI